MNRPRNAAGILSPPAAQVLRNRCRCCCGQQLPRRLRRRRRRRRRRWRRRRAGLRRHPHPRRHRRRQQGHPRPAPPVTGGRHRALQQPLRAAAVLEQQLRAGAGARRVRRGVRRTPSPGPSRCARASPSTTASPSPPTTRGSASSGSPNPKAPHVGRRPALQIIDFESSKVVDDNTLQLVLKHALRDPRLAARRVHPRHHPRQDFDSRTRSALVRSRTSRSSPARPARSPSTPTTGATRPSSTSSDPGLRRRQRQGQRAAGRPDPDVDNLPYNLIDTIKGAGGGTLVTDSGAWVPFTMRVDQAPFNDVKVRQAFRLIVDRQQMIVSCP